MSTAPESVTSLDQPLYGASIGEAFVRFWRKYFVFSGRASRSEYWWWYLTAVIINAVLNGLGRIDGPVGNVFNVVGVLWGIATIVPTLALLWRRLHDTNRSGLWAFAPLVLLFAGFVLVAVGGALALAHNPAALAIAVTLWIIAAVIFLLSAIIILILTVLPANPAGARFDRARR